MFRLFLLLVIFFLSTICYSPWPLAGHDASNTFASEFNGPNNPQILWKAQVGPSDLDEVWCKTPVIDNNRTFIFSAGYYSFSSLFKSNGTFLWKKDFNWMIPSPAISRLGDKSNDFVCAIELNDLVCYLWNGSEKHRRRLSEQNLVNYGLSTPIITDDFRILFTTSFSGASYVLSLDNNLYLDWQIRLKGLTSIIQGVVINQERTKIFVATFDNLYALDYENNGIIWQLPFGVSTLSVSGSYLLVVRADDYSLNAIETNSGDILWTSSDTKFWTAPVVDLHNGTVFSASRNGGLFTVHQYTCVSSDLILGYDMKTGEKKFQYNVTEGLSTYQLTMDSAGVIYFGSCNGIGALATRRKTPELKWFMKTNPPMSAPAIDENGVLFVCVYGNQLLAVGDKQNKF